MFIVTNLSALLSCVCVARMGVVSWAVRYAVVDVCGRHPRALMADDVPPIMQIMGVLLCLSVSLSILFFFLFRIFRF